jgi:ribosomal protein L11 methyltransferase
MQYVKVVFSDVTPDMSDMLIAILAEAGYDGFEEGENSLMAYIEQPRYHKEELESLAGKQGIGYETELIPAQNWNALWESNFQPVIIPGLCTIRATFSRYKSGYT